ncbi:contact-dependent growth inhibition system immunity protein [Curtobacterium sp. MCSS17_007]|uniref:contact-dependent growth inhibition system immunity protein n=1 Tax=Curtobacterium sp. MCSS17_007 TaxID=2175646 RepID=UPI0011B73E00|nr:contact-dependent growth inhibition system immunity protein [Curtobacterium sp. MCSS17_007]WIE76234.1 contact-dependent growth inhibition system immunity protein [Curtobacterium sp. MCSS17_007]
MTEHTVRTGGSYFPSVERADDAVAYALDANHERIRSGVANGAHRPLRIYAVPGGVTGRGNPFLEPQDLEAVRVVLVGTSDDSSGYFVFTAYPAVASITERNFHGFDTFVGTYFHQDWAEEPYSAEQALEDHLARSSPGALSELLEDVRDLDGVLPDEAALGGRLIELDCNYVPSDDGIDDRTWLREVAARVEWHLSGADPGVTR